MKIRTDFVTNSSSSSFIVAFEKVPETAAELVEMMFSESEKKYGCFAAPYGGDLYDINVIAEIVFSDIINQKPNDKKRIKEELGYVSNYDTDFLEYTKKVFPRFPEFDRNQSDEDRRIAWDAYGKQLDEFADDLYKRFINKAELKGKTLFVFNYSDNDGNLGCAMEHGNLFKRFQSFRISKH